MTTTLQAPPVVTEWLTDREVDVVRLMVEGLNNRQIGARLDITPHTVRVHISNAVRTLRLPNKVALAVWFVRNTEVSR